LGNKITSYLIFWWIVLVTVVACFIAEISIMQFDCMFGDIMDIIATCSTYPVLKKTHDFFIASCILDIFTDVLIICFPISILWRTRMNLRQKLYMSGIFSLVGFTIAVTVVRGSIFGGVYKSIDSNKRQEMNTTWIWFWFTMEYSVSFIIACLVSFRGLFAQASKKSNQESEARKRQAMPPSRHSIGFAARMRRLHDTIQDTCKTLEGTRSDDDLLLPRPPSPSIGLDFTHGSGDTHWTSLSKSKASQASQDHSRAESMTSHAVPLSVRSAPPSRNA
jgi:small-conductance mechanosensitive channel